MYKPLTRMGLYHYYHLWVHPMGLYNITSNVVLCVQPRCSHELIQPTCGPQYLSYAGLLPCMWPVYNLCTALALIAMCAQMHFYNTPPWNARRKTISSPLIQILPTKASPCPSPDAPHPSCILEQKHWILNNKNCCNDNVNMTWSLLLFSPSSRPSPQ